MSIRRFTEVEAYQHADDGYYYRPLVAGKELFSYVAHVPAGGYMPPDAEEAELFELSLFMLEGNLDGILDEDRIALTAGMRCTFPGGCPSEWRTGVRPRSRSCSASRRRLPGWTSTR